MNKNLKYHIQPMILAKKLPKKIGESAYGYSYDSGIFVGLPASNMKGKWIQFTVAPSERPNGVVPIGDIGPWNGGGWDNKFGDPYWRKRLRPQAESGKDLRNRKTDKSGIQFSHKLWTLLRLKGKKHVIVNWHFVPAPKNKKVTIISKDGKRKLF
jgi:hypothetical protein